jgi:hypothetical protein
VLQPRLGGRLLRFRVLLQLHLVADYGGGDQAIDGDEIHPNGQRSSSVRNKNGLFLCRTVLVKNEHLPRLARDKQTQVGRRLKPSGRFRSEMIQNPMQASEQVRKRHFFAIYM